MLPHLSLFGNNLLLIFDFSHRFLTNLLIFSAILSGQYFVKPLLRSVPTKLNLCVTEKRDFLKNYVIWDNGYSFAAMFKQTSTITNFFSKFNFSRFGNSVKEYFLVYFRRYR